MGDSTSILQTVGPQVSGGSSSGGVQDDPTMRGVLSRVSPDASGSQMSRPALVPPQMPARAPTNPNQGLAQGIARNQERIANLDQVVAQPLPAPPPMPALPPAPVRPLGSAFGDFGSVASALASLASLTTRRPLIGALNSISQAMDAHAQGRQEEFQEKMREWKEQTDQALKLQEAQDKRYKSILAGRKQDIEGMQAAISAEAAGNQDFHLMAMQQNAQGELAERMIHDRAELAQRASEHADTMGIERQRLHDEQADRQFRETLEVGNFDMAKQRLQMDQDDKKARESLAEQRLGMEMDDPKHLLTKKWMDEHPKGTVQELSDFLKANNTKPLSQTELDKLSAGDTARQQVLMESKKALSILDDTMNTGGIGSGVTGGIGRINRIEEWVTSTLNPEVSTPATTFARNISNIKIFLPQAIGASGRLSAQQKAELSERVDALKPGMSPAEARDSLMDIVSMVNSYGEGFDANKSNRAAGGTATPGAPSTPRSQSDYDALPSGSRYVDPDTNTVKVKR